MKNKYIVIVSSILIVIFVIVLVLSIKEKDNGIIEPNYYQSDSYDDHDDNSINNDSSDHLEFDITKSPNYYENLPEAKMEYKDTQYGEEFIMDDELFSFTACDKDGDSVYGFLTASTDNCIDYLLQKYNSEYEVIHTSMRDTCAEYVIKISGDIWLISEGVGDLSMMWPYNYTEEEIQQTIEETGYIPEL